MTIKKAEFLGTFVRPGGDDEELRLTFAIPEIEKHKALTVLMWGKQELKITIEPVSGITVKGRFSTPEEPHD